MLLCMADDLVHLFKDNESAKTMWDALRKRYAIMSRTKLRALALKVGKLKCTKNKRMKKHLLTLSSTFTNLLKTGHPYSDERKSLTLLNSFHDSKDREHMHFKRMHKFNSYE